jgi:hypothetical protein
VAVNVWPAIVAVALRDPAPFADAVNVTVPLPVPDAPLATVNQVVSLLAALHEHQLPVVTVIVAVSPDAASAMPVGEIEYVHGPAACDAVNV